MVVLLGLSIRAIVDDHDFHTDPRDSLAVKSANSQTFFPCAPTLARLRKGLPARPGDDWSTSKTIDKTSLNSPLGFAGVFWAETFAD
jgi:hypothetical protein